MRWSIKTALTLAFVLLAALPLLGSGFFAMNYLSTRMEKEISNKNLLLANSYAREIERFLDQSSRRLNNMAHLLEAVSLISAENLNKYLELAVSNYPDLELVRVLDSNGTVVSLAPFDKNISGLDMSRQAYYISAKQQQSTHWSNIFISPQTGASTLALAIPFKGGMLVGHLSLFSVREIIDSVNIGPGALVTVVDKTGTAIAHHNQSLVEQRSDLSNYAHVAQGLAGNEGNFRYRINKQKRVGSVAMVHGADWVVAVSQSLDEIFLPINNLKYIIFLAAIFAVFIAVLAAFFSLERILSPLKRITQNARKIASGDYTIESVESSYIEIADLDKSFKTMIKEVKDRETSLIESEEKFRSLMEQSSLSIQIFNMDGKIIQINEAWKRLWGVSDTLLPELLENFNVLKDESAREMGVMPLIEKAFKGESVILPILEYDAAATMKSLGLSDSEGNKRWIEARFYPLKNTNNEVINVVNMEEDLTERKQAEIRIHQMHEFTDHLIQTANVIIIGLDNNRELTHFNPAAEQITGYKFAEVEGENWFELFVPIDKFPDVHEEFNHRLKSGVPKYFENPILTKNEEERFISWTNSEVRQNETVVGTISFGMDITERKQSEQKLQEYQKRLKALSSQLAIIEEKERREIAADLHDHVGQSLALARMQLDSIIGAKSGLETKIIVKDISNILLKALQETRSLIFELSSPSMNEIGLAAAISEWMDEHIARRSGLQIECIDRIKGDHKKVLNEDVRVLLFRNVRELLTNVVKHARAKKVAVVMEIVDEKFKIVVKDDGIGFDIKATGAKIKKDGGFGLFSIQERMSDFGGTFDISSETGKGSQVTLTLPIGVG